MATSTKVALGLAATAGLLGLLYFVTRPAAAAPASNPNPLPGPTPNPNPLPAGPTWHRVTTIPNGAQARISLPVALLAPMLPQNTVNDFAAWGRIATSMLGSLSTGLTVYPPTGTPARPADWPSDDPDPTTEYSAAFTYTGPIALPMPAGKFIAWTLS